MDTVFRTFLTVQMVILALATIGKFPPNHVIAAIDATIAAVLLYCSAKNRSVGDLLLGLIYAAAMLAQIFWKGA